MRHDQALAAIRATIEAARLQTKSRVIAAAQHDKQYEALRKALTPLVGKIDIATMREANLRAAGNDAASSPDAVAQWLWEKVGKK